jgi:hypothetical protein
MRPERKYNSPIIPLLTTKSLDSGWLIDVLVELSAYKVAFDKLDANDIDGYQAVYKTIHANARLKRMVTYIHFLAMEGDLFSIFTSILQHMCARIRRHQLIRMLQDGIYVLYRYYFYYYASSGNEEVILDLVNEFKPHRTRIMLCTKVFENYCQTTNYHKDFKLFFRKKHGEHFQLPEFFIVVPWQQAISLVANRQVFLLHAGYLYMDYTHVAEWMANLWCSHVEYWRKWDRDEIVFPAREPFLEQLKAQVPQTQAMKPHVYEKMLGAMMEERFFRPFVEIMKLDMFVSFKDQQKAAASQSSVKLTEEQEKKQKKVEEVRNTINYAYGVAFKHGNAVAENNAPDTSRPSGSMATLDTKDLVGKFAEDYIKIMPPCVASLYKNHVSRRTHFKYSERLWFFSWCHKMGIPLSVLETEWRKMIENDSSVPIKQHQSMVADLKSQYQKYESQRQDGKEYNFSGCEKSKDYCPFRDIEDLGNRQNHCCEIVSTNKPIALTVFWDRQVFEKRWSPMRCSRNLIFFEKKR